MVNMEGPIALKHGMNCGTIHASTCLVVGYCHKWQYPNNHPLCHLCEQLSSCFFSTSLHLAALPSLPFWERLQHNIPFKPSALIPIVGIPPPPCADRGCTNSCSTEGKAHWHNILRGLANCLHPRERFILLEIRERIQNKYMEEEDHFTLLYSQLIFTALAAAAMAARLLPLQLSFSPHSCTHSRFSHSFFSQI